MDKQKIAVFYTGGTISMKKGKGGVDVQERNPLDIEMDAFLEAHGIEILQNQVFGKAIPSPHMTLPHMLTLRNAVMQAAKDKSIDGVVITHGTDTMEETAYFLDITTRLDIPVVLTGSMRSPDAVGSDSLSNYQAALQVAAAPEYFDSVGVLVVLGDEIHPARDVTKTHSTSLDTFKSPPYGPVGFLTTSGPCIRRYPPVRGKPYDVLGMEKDVLLIRATAGMQTSIFDALEALAEKQGSYPFGGLVVEAFGCGNIPPALVEPLKRVAARGLPIVLATRCPTGRVEPVYSYPGGAGNLRSEIPAIVFSAGLSGVKSRIKLAVLINAGLKPSEIADAFTE